MRARHRLRRFCVAASVVARAGFAESSDLALDRPNPSAAGDEFAAVGEPITDRTRGEHAVRLTSNYAHRLVEAQLPEDQGEEVLVSDQWVAHLQARVSWPAVDRLVLLTDVPLALVNSGDPSADGSVNAYTSPRASAFGNIRTGLRWGLQTTGAVRSAVDLEFAWPTSRAGSYLGSDGGSYTLRLHGDVEDGAYRLVFSAWGRKDLPREAVLGAEVGSRVGLGITIGEIRTGAEAIVWYSPSIASARSDAHAEVWAHLNYSLGSLEVRVAGGPGFALGPGTPAFRALLALGYRWETPDVAAEPQHIAPAPSFSNTRVTQLTNVGIAGQIDSKPLVEGKARAFEPKSTHAEASEGAAPTSCNTDDCRTVQWTEKAGDVLLEPVLFATGTDLLPIEVEKSLGAVVASLLQHPEVVRVAVEGHTDDVGAESANLALSRRRAIAVVRWLIAHGVDERRLQVRAFGPRYPRFDNGTEEGRRRNRRVEFTVVERSPLGENTWHTGPAKQPTTEVDP